MAGFFVLIVTNALVLAAAPGQEGLQVRGLHHLFQAGRHMVLALGVVVVVVAAQRFGLLVRRRGYLLLGAVAVMVAAVTLVEELVNFAGTVLPSAPLVATWVLVLVVAGAVVVAAAVGRALGRPRWRWLAVVSGVGVLLVHPQVLAGYPGAHLFMAAAAVAAIAGALVTARLPPRWSQLVAAAPWALLAALGLFTLVVPPSNALQVEMLRRSEDVVTPFLPQVGRASGHVMVTLPPGWAPWFAARDEVAAIPASKPLLKKPPIVLLVTIDSLRADTLGAKHDAKLPNLAAFRDASLRFRQARAPGSQTITTLTEMFMGKYYSQQYWSVPSHSSNLWPFADESPRFPGLLAEVGIPTFNAGSTSWLINDLGILRGFTEDQYVKPVGTHFTLSELIMPLLFERLGRVGEGPLFAYVHLMDAHHTARPLGTKLEDRERYMLNLQTIDGYIGALVAEVERLGLADRCYIIVSSDHGEAFGEHGTFKHNVSVYDELLRVPLMIKGPKVKPRAVNAAVSLMDVGPTVLDIFGVATPGPMMGESLVEFIRGKNPKLTRPIAAEGRLKRTLVFPDGMKAIVDDRNGTAEVYNLKTDPGERINLLDVDPRANERVAAVHQFFEVHRYKAGGYVVPYRR